VAAEASEDEKRRLDFCARIFNEPSRFISGWRILDAGPLCSRLHSHTDLIQFDLVHECSGTVDLEGETIAVKPVTAFVFYPRRRHGHALKKANSESEVLTLKLVADINWPAIARQSFAKICHAPMNEKRLIRSMRRLAWLSATERNQSLAALTTLAEVIALWPGAGGEADNRNDWMEAKGSLDNVLKLIDQNLSAPPDIREMAEVAALSPRQFSRQFVAMMGRTPHDYVTERRLARAKEMLASGQMNVTEVSETLGFPTIHGFSRWFLRATKINPSEFRDHPTTL
jgi:AraC-like DNA-binding protein